MEGARVSDPSCNTLMVPSSSSENQGCLGRVIRDRRSVLDEGECLQE